MAKLKEKTVGQELRDELLVKRAKTGISSKKLLSSGSTLLNLATTGRVNGCYIKGMYHYVVGDSTSGKTWLVLQALAEAAKSKHFKDYRLIYDNVEDGALMDVSSYFGSKLAERIEAPMYNDGEPRMSETIEDFYYNVDDALSHDRPCIYVLDSHDALDSEAASKKFVEQKKASRKGKEISGSYGDGKAKTNSANIRRLRAGLARTGSILIIISQTRDSLGFGFETKTRSGGRALKFYATTEVWFSVRGKIKKDVRGKKRTIGIYSQADIKKNRLNGRSPSVLIPIYHSVGVDDVGGCVDFMLKEKFWLSKGGKVHATDLDLALPKEALIAKIEADDLEMDLRAAVGAAWLEIEKACAIQRKPRYE